MEKSNQVAEQDSSKKSSRLSQTDIPGVSITEALRIPTAIRDSYALQPATPIEVGKAIGIAPTSGGFRMLTGAAIAYGLTTGGYNASEIALTELGRRIVAPEEEGDSEIAKREAFEKPRVIKEFVQKYNGGKLPSKEIIKSVLNSRMGVPFDATDRAYELLTAGLKDLDYLENINGGQFLTRPRNGVPSVREPVEQNSNSKATAHVNESDFVSRGDERKLDPQKPDVKPRPNAIFLGHGKNRKPLEQLIKILDEYGIPYKEATAEANAGRPIPVKVADTMRECGAAILIFSADEKFQDEDGKEIWRPSENVVHELGAASVLYDNRIIIFKEESVSLASNFSGIGYIGFEKDKLNDKGVDLFRELVKFKIININVSG